MVHVDARDAHAWAAWHLFANDCDERKECSCSPLTQTQVWGQKKKCAFVSRCLSFSVCFHLPQFAFENVHKMTLDDSRGPCAVRLVNDFAST